MRIVGEMEGSDEIMANTLFLGTYPGLTAQMLSSEVDVITSFSSVQKLSAQSSAVNLK